MNYYNNKRIKAKLKGKSPIQYRTLAQQPLNINPSNFLGSLQTSTSKRFVLLF
uniref:IS3 family transposase n=1 Tax=Anaerobacillus isosaccharinicus TaxID=1532552 RepID=A0A7S7L993_9BACI|nr:IS3 family transposase [Anaerobacillus isosaccharinicus]QOY36809.1 IS3 family transposase [Anaerobacillus isosaccharinicus]